MAYCRVLKYHSDKLHASEGGQLENVWKQMSNAYCVSPHTINQGTSPRRDISHSVETQVSQARYQSVQVHHLSSGQDIGDQSDYMTQILRYVAACLCVSLTLLQTYLFLPRFRFSHCEVVDRKPRVGLRSLQRVFVNLPVLYIHIKLLYLDQNICTNDRKQWKMYLQ
jgi:hypothetical protein